jgi:hypothetical protein
MPHGIPNYNATASVRGDGTLTGDLANYTDALRPLKNLYGRTPAKEFSPKKLNLNQA